MVSALLAAIPILTLLLLLLVVRWSAARAALVSLTVAIVLAMGPFGYGTTTYSEIGLVQALLGILAESLFATGTIIWILFPALAIYHLQRLTEALDVLQDAIRSVADQPLIVVLLVGWFFALFIEGAAGFGTPVALAAPFLTSAGFNPVLAVALALIGGAAGVSFGAVGTPIVPQAEASGYAPELLAQSNGVVVAAAAWVLPLVLFHWVSRAASPPHLQRGMLWSAAAALFFLTPMLVVSRYVGSELPTLTGALIGGTAFIALWRRFGTAPSLEGRRAPPGGVRLVLASSPYLVTVLLIALTRLVPSIRAELSSLTWSFRVFEHFTGSLAVIYHPGTILAASLLVAAAIQRSPPRLVLEAVHKALRQVAPAALSLVAVLALSKLMVHAGMIGLLARGAAAAAGPAWPVAAPFVGALGSFMTGSATSSNILFSDFQILAARQASVPPLVLLGAQGFGAAAGNMIAPLNILAGAATVGAVGKESEILRKTLGVCLAYTLLGGLVTWVLVTLV